MSGDLEGARVLVTRRRKDSERLAGMIEAEGGSVSIVPMTTIGPPRDPVAVDVARQSIAEFDWIAVTSRHGAVGLLGGLGVPESDRPKIAAVGAATAESVRRTGWPVDLLASGRGARALADEMVGAGVARGSRVLYPCSDLARTDLRQALQADGAEVVALEVYQTVPHADGDALHEECNRAGRWHVAVFASPSAVSRFVEVAGDPDQVMVDRLAVGIGPTTAQALREVGGWQIVESRSRDDGGLLEAVERAYAQTEERKRRRR
jgi:uroporphyrinogen-III synthase